MKILLLSAHADDVELGAGGTITKYVMNNLDTDILWIAFSSPYGCNSLTTGKEFENVCKHLRSNGLVDLNLNSQLFNFSVRNFNTDRQTILDTLIKIKKDFKPNIVFGPATTDIHQDHKVISEEMIRCFKDSATIIGYEMPWNQLTTNSSIYVKLKRKHMIHKLAMLNCYKKQIKERSNYFNEEVVLGQGRINGAVIKADYAEKFECIRMIQ